MSAVVRIPGTVRILAVHGRAALVVHTDRLEVQWLLLKSVRRTLVALLMTPVALLMLCYCVLVLIVCVNVHIPK